MSNNRDQHIAYEPDPPETAEWLEALASVMRIEGNERAKYLLGELASYAHYHGVEPPVTTSYRNSIPVAEEAQLPDKEGVINRLLAAIRWNAVALVLHAGKVAPEVGGHIATYASAAVLYEIGMHYFFRGYTADQLGDMVFVQGHASPGIYARAYLEGRM